MIKRMVRIWAIMFVFMILAAGCAPVISKNLREQVEKEISFKDVIQSPEAYQGKVVLWGGEIIGAKNTKEGTLIEVLQKPTDSQGKPKKVDRSDGRFLALYDGYLDVAIYAKGRDVTVAGEVKGKRVLPLGEIEYTYPIISAKEIHLWPKKIKERHYYHYPVPYRYYPWWYYHPCSETTKKHEKEVRG
jgi:outer membrane lipoprotein